MKKTLVLLVLFVLPIVAYLFFASGVNNFGKLPVLTTNIPDISQLDSETTLQNKITVLGFLGHEVNRQKGNLFNLNQKIYKRFYEFNDFQFVMVLPKGTENEIVEIKKQLGKLVDLKKWKFIFVEDNSISTYFSRLKTDVILDEHLGTPYVFIIDKDLGLRGRKKDEDQGTKFGYNTNSVAELNNKMEDDVKIILAEYRLALKKNNAERAK